MRRVLLLLALVLAPQLLGAQALPFLYSPVDARSAAMGGAGVALDADAWAMDKNLSAAALSDRQLAAGVAYERWAPALTADNRFCVAGWYRADRWAFGLSAKGMISPAFKPADDKAETRDELFNPKDLGFSLGAAWQPVPGFAFSASARLVHSVLDTDTHGTAICGDFAMTYARDAIQAGLSVSNLGGRIRYAEADYALPTLLRGGISYTHPVFSLTAEADYLFQAGLMASAGAEIRPLPVLALRLGYHYGAADKGLPGFVSCGLGIDLDGVVLNAACLFGSQTLGGTFCIGMGYSF